MSPIVAAALLLASGPVRTVSLTAETIQAPVRVVCPVGQTTRLVFPWPMLEARGKPADVETIGLVPAASRPQGVLEIQPASHPASARILIQFDDEKKRSLILAVRSSESGVGSEVRFAWRDTPPATARTAAPSPVPSARPSERSPNPGTRAPGSPAPKVPPVTAPSSPPEAVPTSAPTPRPATSPTPEVSASPLRVELDALGMARATSVKINRREGRPGQRPVVLEDALHGDRNVPGGDRWIWFRFRVLGGASLPGSTKVQSLKWEKGSIDAFHVEASGKDLRVYVQLPRAEVTKKTRVELGLSDGARYRFALNSPWLASFLSSLF